MHAHRAYIQICQMMPIHAETLIHSLEYFRNDTYCKEEEKKYSINLIINPVDYHEQTGTTCPRGSARL